MLCMVAIAFYAKPGTQCHCQCCTGKNHGAGEQKAIATMQSIYAQGTESLPAGAEVIKVPDRIKYIQQELPIPATNDYGRPINWPGTTIWSSINTTASTLLPT